MKGSKYVVDELSAIDSKIENLAAELDYAKEHPFSVPLDFETRFRVWRDQILPDRILQLRKNLSLERVNRFNDLTVADVHRLYRRATTEFLEVADDLETTGEKLKFFQNLYLGRQNLLYNGYTGFVNDLKSVINEHNKRRT